MLSSGDKGFTGGLVSTTTLLKAFGPALFELLLVQAYKRSVNIAVMIQTPLKLYFFKCIVPGFVRIILKENKNLVVKIKDIQFDIDKMEVFKNSTEVNLTSLELKILHLLFNNLNKVVKRDEIIEKIWEWTGNDVNDNTVTVYLKRIRKKLDSDIIKTIKGIGYRVDTE